MVEERVEQVERGGQAEQRTSSVTRSAEGPIAPGDYLLIVVLGPAQVKVDGLPVGIQPGDTLAAADGGRASKATPIEVQGVQFLPPGIAIGQAMEPLDALQKTGLIWVWVMPR